MLYSRQGVDEFGNQTLETTFGYFNTIPVHVVGDFDLGLALLELKAKDENFTSRGSGYSIDVITDSTLIISRYSPLSGSSFFPTPRKIAAKHCTLNIENSDNMCFVYSVLAKLHCQNVNHRERVSHYRSCR